MFRTTAATLALVAQLSGTAAQATPTDAPAPQITAAPGMGVTLPVAEPVLPDCANAPQTAHCALPIEDAAYRPVEPQIRAFA